MKTATAWVGLGANTGDRLGSLARALRALRGVGGVRVTGVSPVYRTSPVGDARQPDFLNAAARVTTRLGPASLVRRLLAIECRMGRKRSRGTRGAARPIDLDLLLMGSLVRDSRTAVVPHPRLHRRRFALRPIVAVDSGVMHPVLGVELRRLLPRVPRSQRVRALGRASQRRFRALAAGRD